MKNKLFLSKMYVTLLQLDEEIQHAAVWWFQPAVRWPRCPENDDMLDCLAHKKAVMVKWWNVSNVSYSWKTELHSHNKGSTAYLSISQKNSPSPSADSVLYSDSAGTLDPHEEHWAFVYCCTELYTTPYTYTLHFRRHWNSSTCIKIHKKLF